MSDEENKTRATTGVKFSAFKQVGPQEGNPVEVVGLRDGENVRAALTTDLIETNPGITFRNAKGQFASPDAGVTELTNQLKVNRYLYDRMLERGVTIDVSPPDIKADGTFWFCNDESSMQLFVFHEESDAWIPVAPPATISDRVAAGEETQAGLVDAVGVLETKVTALEGAVGEHSLVFTTSNSNPRAGEFNLKDQANQMVNTLSDAKFIYLSDEDRAGNTINIDRITEGDVMRLSDISGVTAELKVVNDAVGGGMFQIEKLFGELDRLSEYPYDFNLFSSFDPQGLATIEYVDAQDDKKLDTAGGRINGNLTINANSTVISGKEATSTGQAILNVKADGPSGKSVIEVRQSGMIKLHNSSGGTLMAAQGDEPITKKAMEYRTLAMHPTWQYKGVEPSDCDASDLQPGEFAIRTEGSGEGLVYWLYMNRKDAFGSALHGFFSNKSYSHGVDQLMNISNSAGTVRFSAKATNFAFNNGSNNYIRVKCSFVKPQYAMTRNCWYTINLPGLCPNPRYSSHWHNSPPENGGASGASVLDAIQEEGFVETDEFIGDIDDGYEGGEQ